MQSEFLLTAAKSLTILSFAPKSGIPGIPSEPAQCVFEHGTKPPSGFAGDFYFFFVLGVQIAAGRGRGPAEPVR